MIDEVVMLRHGRTTYNLARRLQGQIDIPLDIIGRWQVDQSAYELAGRYYWAKASHIAAHPEMLQDMQAKDCTEQLCERGVADVRECSAAKHVMRIVSSDLYRAQQTAHAFADIMGLPVELDARLRERSFGEWEGMTREEVCERWPEDYASWRAHTGGETRHGVETRVEVGTRGAAAVHDMIARSQSDPTQQTLMLVGHGSWIVATIETLLNMDPDSLSNLGAVGNACWSRLTPVYKEDGVQWLLEEFNCRPQAAAMTDWENGPDYLRNPDMPKWRVLQG